MENLPEMVGILMTDELKKSLMFAFRALPSDWESYFTVNPETGEVILRNNEDYSSWLLSSQYSYCSVISLLLLVLSAFNNGRSSKDK